MECVATAPNSTLTFTPSGTGLNSTFADRSPNEYSIRRVHHHLVQVPAKSNPKLPQTGASVSDDVVWNRMSGLTEVFEVMHPTLDNILFHTRWNQWLIPVLSNKILDIFSSLPARNHYVLVRCPWCGFSNAY